MSTPVSRPRIKNENEVWDIPTLSWVAMLQPATSGGGGGGGAVTIANGANTVEGSTTDVAVTDDINGTISGKLRGLVKVANSVWDSGNGRLIVDGSSVIQPVDGSSVIQPVSISAELPVVTYNNIFTAAGQTWNIPIGTATVALVSWGGTFDPAATDSYFLTSASIDGIGNQLYPFVRYDSTTGIETTVTSINIYSDLGFYQTWYWIPVAGLNKLSFFSNGTWGTSSISLYVKLSQGGSSRTFVASRQQGLWSVDQGTANTSPWLVKQPEYITSLDFVSGANPIYIGSAVPSSATSAAVWQIRKLTYDGSSNLTNIQYAAGTTAFSSIWDNRTLLSYS
jgi:hypothetical protein